MGKGIPYFLEWVHRYLFKDSAKRRGIYWKEGHLLEEVRLSKRDLST